MRRWSVVVAIVVVALVGEARAASGTAAELLGAEGRHRYANLLQVLLTALRRDHDLLERAAGLRHSRAADR